MSETPAQLRRQIGSASDLQSVVRAMKAQAAASIGQYAKSVAALADYALTVELGLAACFRQSPLAAGADRASMHEQGPPVHAVIFGSDQGLVGRFNDTLFEYAQQALSERPASTQVWAVGERMCSTLADGGLSPLRSFAVPGNVQAITRLVGDILLTAIDTAGLAATSGSRPELHLFYNRPTVGSSYRPVSQQLLPLDAAWRRDLEARAWPTALLPQVIGTANDTLRGLISEFLFVSIFRASAESLASENASRLAAMDRADRNIDKMLSSLNDRFHRLRQDKIDGELSDLISGFKALSE